MKRLKWLFQPVLIFVVAQVSWALLMTVWIRWYVTRNREIDDLLSRYSLKEGFGTGQWVVLVEGCLLMAIILVGLYIIFASLRKQTKLNKLQDSILSNVTHELKTPLASIRLYCETMLLRDLTREEQKKFLKRALSESERLQKLIDTVLISARMSSEASQNDFERIRAMDAFDLSWKKILERFGDQRQFELHFDSHIPQEDLYILGNVHQLSIVFDNLLDNSVKYTDKGGVVRAKVSSSSQFIKFEIFDNGMGIEKGNLKRVFRRFFRAEKTSVKKVQGSGLGLYVCQTTIKAHQGKIFATSDGSGKGSHFHVELPRQTADY